MLSIALFSEWLQGIDLAIIDLCCSFDWAMHGQKGAKCISVMHTSKQPITYLWIHNRHILQRAKILIMGWIGPFTYSYTDIQKILFSLVVTVLAFGALGH